MLLDISAKRTVAPDSTPISVAELRSHLRIDGLSDVYEDAYLELLIAAAVGVCEEYCRIALITQTWQAKLDAFDDEIILPRPPVIAVNSITYVDGDGATQTLSSSVYQVDTFSRPGRVLKAYNQSWPTTRNQAQGVTITWTTGYGDAEDVPESLKSGLKLLCGAWYGLRDSIDPGKPDQMPLPWAVGLLFDQYKSARAW